jgi:uncharacterized SAM-binding protein YcdF (DUF218 family)
LYSAEILKKKDLAGEKHLVFTSATHLRRAMLCFKKTDLEVDGFSTDFYGGTRSFTHNRLLVPDPSAFSDWHLMFNEWVGIIFYKLAGYI